MYYLFSIGDNIILIDFVEYFNVSEDKWQMHNLWKKGDEDVQAKLSAKLRVWFSCRGGDCM